MEIVKTFGDYVERLSENHQGTAQWLLKTGWEAQELKFRFAPDKRLLPADRYLAYMMMDTMLQPLRKPQESAVVSVFTPCELLQEVSLNPYNVESFSCYLAASCAERVCLQQAENDGISETLCSYHKTFIGAARRGILPKPKCIVYTNLACDANLLTFQYLADLFEAPAFAIDVPFEQNKENVRYVAEQLQELTVFLEKHTGKKIEISGLKERLARSRRTLENIHQCQIERAKKCIPTDLVTPLYGSMTGQILLGTREEEKYTELLLRNIRTAPEAHGKRIYWMHTIPFWSDAVKKEFRLNDNAQIVGCELSQTFDLESREFDPEKPYEAMAERMVYHCLNGSVQRRIQAGIRHAKDAGADGVVWFDHWGCKHTLGAAQLAKKKFEEAGIPLLILDGDGCDRSHGGEGQTATRLGAFLEMLEEADES
ncbi:MAG: 2-hydroxyacyl-CoA dehydratase family protein [Eubacteriales bacterium]|nr:2-hydroxyacyl-CoA dehydratase family protein [Eubacteriales bacterium]